MHEISNKDIAHIFSEMAALYEMKDVEFKPRAYERAAQSVSSQERELGAVYKQGGRAALEEIPGIGARIAEHIEALLTTGHFEEYDTLKDQMPVDIETLTAIEGVGPQTVKALYRALGVRTIDDLEEAAREGKIRTVEGFGEKTEHNILEGVQFLRSRSGRSSFGSIVTRVSRIEERVQELKGVTNAEVAGSVRRKKETVGDIDLLVVSDTPTETMGAIASFPEVVHVYGKGSTKTNVRLRGGIDMDIRIVPAASWGAALAYFTGSRAHNVKVRTVASERGYKLNEYGLFSGEDMIAGATEEEIYAALGMSYIPPELREDTGEIEAAQNGELPDLVAYGSLKGDLQVQTNWTDGESSIEDMARAAYACGLSYMAITDHTRSLQMAGGADEKKLARQMRAIDELNETFKREEVAFRVLKGAEVNIQKDGSLDIDDATLSALDVVGAAVHSYFRLSRKEQTERVIRAVEHPHVDILFHPTARIINRRKPIDIDIEAVVDAAKRAGTVLEVDAYPGRLDLKDEHIRLCKEKGVPMVIDSDAHAQAHFSFLSFGVAQARRGWAEKADIVNTLPLQDFLAAIKRRAPE